MGQLPTKPVGTVIEEAGDAEGLTLSWPLPSAGLMGYAMALFFAFWLCLWAVGWLLAAAAILSGRAPFVAQIFLVGWLSFWTLGGCAAMRAFWWMVRPSRPESVRLEAQVLRYNPGRTARETIPAVTLRRSEIRGFVLERVDRDRRLYIDRWFNRAEDRVEIGEFLRESEREWLFAVLQAWYAPTGAVPPAAVVSQKGPAPSSPSTGGRPAAPA